MSDDYPHALPKGHSIEEYEIVRVLGAGGFGITYLARDHNLDGPIALKEYFPREHATRISDRSVAALSAEESRDVFAWGRDRFIEEARAIHGFRHQNVVRVQRYVETHGTAYIVMEYVEGKSLAAVLKERGVLTAAEWRPWLDRLLSGLAHVHAHGYLHRDIKPSNIVIRATDGEPVLIDFGSARFAARDRIHTRVLTPAYAPIEQHSSEAGQGPFTDIYSLAAVSYRALNGELPPSAPDRMLDDRYEPLAERMADADQEWLAVIDRGLAPRPEDRPPAVWEWGTALADSLGDAQQVAAWCRQAADQGNVDAQVKLGRMYNSGKGVPRDHARAAECYRRAARWGFAEAQFALGQMHHWGQGVEPNYDEAQAWWLRAADQGHAKAQVCLGRLFLKSLYDPEQAAAWFRKAADQGDAAGQFALGQMSPSKQAVEWYRRAADQGHAKAQLALGRAYEQGTGVPHDDEHALNWYSRAADSGDPAAQCSLGRMLWPNDRELALAWYRKAADQHYAVAAFIIAEEKDNKDHFDGPSLTDAARYTPHRGLPIDDYEEYANFVEEYYLSLDDDLADLDNDEESLLAAIFSVYSELKYNTHGSGLFDSVFTSLCNDDEAFGLSGDPNDFTEQQEELQEAISTHLVRAVERCGEDRREILACQFDEKLSECRGALDDHHDNLDSADVDDIERLVEDSADELEASLEAVSQQLAKSSSWLARWAPDKHAIDILVRYVQQLNKLQRAKLDTMRENAEVEVAELRRAIEELRQ